MLVKAESDDWWLKEKGRERKREIDWDGETERDRQRWRKEKVALLFKHFILHHQLLTVDHNYQPSSSLIKLIPNMVSHHLLNSNLFFTLLLSQLVATSTSLSSPEINNDSSSSYLKKTLQTFKTIYYPHNQLIVDYLETIVSDVELNLTQPCVQSLDKLKEGLKANAIWAMKCKYNNRIKISFLSFFSSIPFWSIFLNLSQF